VPAWVRDGAILPLADPVVCTRDLRHAPVTFRCFGPRASGRYWQDDGATFACERGVFNDWQLDLRRGKLTAQARHAGYRPPRRQYFAESGRRRWALSGLGT
jgi:alpha-glucosidase (family GH31 glycosyl hydrolase)